MCWTAADTMPCEPSAPERARRFVVRALSRAATPDGPIPTEWRSLTEDAELVVSELTTNALMAKCRDLQVSLELHRTELLVTVRDDAAGWPSPRRAAPTDQSGRGLHLVSVMSADWGTAPVDGGKTVWAALAVPEACARIVNCTR